jgi:hypothetical protein
MPTPLAAGRRTVPGWPGLGRYAEERLMPETTQSLRVTGTVAAGSNGMLLMLAERLDGHDTFLTGRR